MLEVFVVNVHELLSLSSTPIPLIQNISEILIDIKPSIKLKIQSKRTQKGEKFGPHSIRQRRIAHFSQTIMVQNILLLYLRATVLEPYSTSLCTVILVSVWTKYGTTVSTEQRMVL